MEERNLDFDLPVTQDQWEQIGRRAQALRPAGFEWKGDEPDRIHVYLRDEEARGLWKTMVSDEGEYGAQQIEVAQFVYNDGRPYAHLEASPSVQEPAVQQQQEAFMGIGQERSVREEWHHLLEESELHSDFGHVPTDVR